MKEVSLGWLGPQDHLGTQGAWASRAVMVLLVKMERQAYQGTAGSQVKRVRLGPQGRRVLLGSEADQDPPVVEVTTPRTHCL